MFPCVLALVAFAYNYKLVVTKGMHRNTFIFSGHTVSSYYANLQLGNLENSKQPRTVKVASQIKLSAHA